MNRVSKNANAPRCEVVGIMLNAAHEPVKNGQIVIMPGKEASLNGIFFSKTPIPLRTDENGCWSANLLPSSLAGEYRITFGGRTTITIVVPDDKTKAQYTELIKDA